jgi:S-adenosylmethionine synthetase
MQNRKLFTSESVTEGHPDKVCDQIADAVLDAIIAKETELAAAGYSAPDGGAADPNAARVACEVLVAKGLVVLGGEVRTQVYVDINQVARDVIAEIGYDNPDLGFDAKTCGILNAIQDQSEEINAAVKNTDAFAEPDAIDDDDPYRKTGAGDQGMVFGYAANETETLMPMPIFLAHRLAERLDEVRKANELDYLRPDGKTQVGVRYENGRPVRVEKVLISSQHIPGLSVCEQMKPDLIHMVIGPVMECWGIDWEGAEVIINPSGSFEKGGPAADTGLTGRKIIVDTYGGYSRHGGGSFSGKDPTKVDRSGAYAMRWVAKNIVAAGLAERCELQVAYAIGRAEPFSMMVESFGTGIVPDAVLAAAVGEVFDLRPGAIIHDLDLVRPIYRMTAAYGHFGRELPEFTWERTDRVDDLMAAVTRLATI